MSVSISLYCTKLSPLPPSFIPFIRLDPVRLNASQVRSMLGMHRPHIRPHTHTPPRWKHAWYHMCWTLTPIPRFITHSGCNYIYALPHSRTALLLWGLPPLRNGGLINIHSMLNNLRDNLFKGRGVTFKHHLATPRAIHNKFARFANALVWFQHRYRRNEPNATIRTRCHCVSRAL